MKHWRIDMPLVLSSLRYCNNHNYLSMDDMKIFYIDLLAKMQEIQSQVTMSSQWMLDVNRCCTVRVTTFGGKLLLLLSQICPKL